MSPVNSQSLQETSVTQGAVSCVLPCRGEIPSRALIIVILYPEAWDRIVCILTRMTINVTGVTQLLRPFKNSSTVFDLATSCIRERAP